MSKELISDQLITLIRDNDQEKQAIAIFISPACFSELVNNEGIGDRIRLHGYKHHMFFDIPMWIDKDTEGWEIIWDRGTTNKKEEK